MKRLLAGFLLLLLCLPASADNASKARTFNGTSDNLQSASALTLGVNKLSVLIWAKWTTNSNSDNLLAELTANYNSNTGGFILDWNAADGFFDANVQTVGGNANGIMACNFTRPSAGSWHAVLLVWDISSATGACTVYVDGTNQSASVTNRSAEVAATFASDKLNIMSRNAASLFAAGSVSEIVIWKTLRSASDATTLANSCTDPTTVDGSNILYFWPIKQVSPETPDIGTVNLTVNGTGTASGPATNCGQTMPPRVM